MRQGKRDAPYAPYLCALTGLNALAVVIGYDLRLETIRTLRFNTLYIQT